MEAPHEWSLNKWLEFFSNLSDITIEWNPTNVSSLYWEKVSECVRVRHFNVYQRAWVQKRIKCLNVTTVLNTLACCEPTWICFEQIRLRKKAEVIVNKMTFVTKCATILCMVTGYFMTHSVHVENICPSWSFGLICTINVSFTILFLDSWVWFMAMFRSLFFLLTSPEGVFQCDHTDWSPLSWWLTS